MQSKAFRRKRSVSRLRESDRFCPYVHEYITVRIIPSYVATTDDEIELSEPYLKAFLVLGSALFVVQLLSIRGDTQILPTMGIIVTGTAAVAGGLYYGLIK